MPRKQNGFGTSKSFAFKGAGRVDKGKGAGAAGYYPGNRRYGTSVHRSVIEKWNLDSDWVKWRKGFEIYNRTSWSELRVGNPLYDPGLPQKNADGITVNPQYVKATLESLLYQGTEYAIKTVFDGLEFPTKNSDVNTHYVAKRSPEYKPLGTVDVVYNDPLVYKKQKQNREIWIKGTPNLENARLLLQMVGERLTDGDENTPVRTEATVKNVLTADGKPAIYRGITAPKSINDSVPQDLQPTEVTVRIPVSDIVVSDDTGTFITSQGLGRKITRDHRPVSIIDDPNQLDGRIIYIPNFFIEKPIADLDAIVWGETEQFFAATILETETGQELFALDPGVEQLPPSMYDITTLPTIFSSTNATYTISGTYVFNKQDYQQYFGKQYLTDEIVQAEVTDLSYSVLPFEIRGAEIVDDVMVITSVPFQSEIKMYPPLTVGGTVVFTDYSFCKFKSKDGKQVLITDVDPWMDEVFTSGENLRPAKIYTCSCPNHSKSILAIPQSYQDEGTRKNNRQRRYPLPTAIGQSRFEGAGTDQAAGRIVSWESTEDRLGFKMCKHSIAAMFVDGITVQEPNQYPTVEARIEFEEKLQDEIINNIEAFTRSYARQGLSLTEIVFALAQGLNLDNVETAYVVLNSEF